MMHLDTIAQALFATLLLTVLIYYLLPVLWRLISPAQCPEPDSTCIEDTSCNVAKRHAILNNFLTVHQTVFEECLFKDGFFHNSMAARYICRAARKNKVFGQHRSDIYIMTRLVTVYHIRYGN